MNIFCRLSGKFLWNLIYSRNCLGCVLYNFQWQPTLVADILIRRRPLLREKQATLCLRPVLGAADRGGAFSLSGGHHEVGGVPGSAGGPPDLRLCLESAPETAVRPGAAGWHAGGTSTDAQQDTARPDGALTDGGGYGEWL